MNSACDVDCPLCFAQAGAGFSLTLEEVEEVAKALAEQNGIVSQLCIESLDGSGWQHLE